MFTRKPCEGCSARQAEIDRLERRLSRYDDQIDGLMKRMTELADPRINERLVQADRLERKPIPAPQRAAPEAPLLPGTEPAPRPSWEVDSES